MSDKDAEDKTEGLPEQKSAEDTSIWEDKEATAVQPDDKYIRAEDEE